MQRTIDYYNTHAKEFCEATRSADMSACRERFLKYLKPGGRILDAGCGSGRDGRAFLDAGYRVTAIDASEQMCREAERLLGQSVQCQAFEELLFEQEFDGIWACASLLHVEAENMGMVLGKLKGALREGGILYASFKYGEGEGLVKERFFHNCTERTLTALFEDTGFEVQEVFVTADVRAGRAAERWVNGIARKAPG